MTPTGGIKLRPAHLSRGLSPSVLSTAIRWELFRQHQWISTHW